MLCARWGKLLSPVASLKRVVISHCLSQIARGLGDERRIFTPKSSRLEIWWSIKEHVCGAIRTWAGRGVRRNLYPACLALMHASVPLAISGNDSKRGRTCLYQSDCGIWTQLSEVRVLLVSLRTCIEWTSLGSIHIPHLSAVYTTARPLTTDFVPVQTNSINVNSRHLVKPIMLPPIEPAVATANPKFDALYQDLCTNRLNTDGSSRLDAKAQKEHDALQHVGLSCHES